MEEGRILLTQKNQQILLYGFNSIEFYLSEFSIFNLDSRHFKSLIQNMLQTFKAEILIKKSHNIQT